MANDFSQDVSCLAAWRFESGALTADSKGSNTLTNNGPVGEDTSDYKEGACCAIFTGSDYFSLLDSALPAGFPTKSGDTVKKFSVCGFVKTGAALPGGGTYQTIIAKQHSTTYSWWLGLNNSRARFLWRYSGSIAYGYDLWASNLAVNTWYFFLVRVDGTGKTFRSFLWNAGTGAYLGGNSQTPANVLQVNAANIGIGAVGDGGSPMPSGGKIDLIVFYNRFITQDEADLVRQGNSATVLGADTVQAINSSAQVEYLEDSQIIATQSLAQVEFDLLSDPVIYGNIFGGDATCVAEWRFNGDLLLDVDSTVYDHELDIHGVCYADTTFRKEGPSSLQVLGNGYLSIGDEDLCATFPGKYGGPRTGTIACWFKPDVVLGSYQYLWAKDHAYGLRINPSGQLEFIYRYFLTGDSSDWGWSTYVVSGLLYPGRWYHITMVWHGTGRKPIMKYLYDSYLNTTTPGYAADPRNMVNTSAYAFAIGAFSDGSSKYTGNIDEVVVFSRCLVPIEIIAVRKKTFPTGPGNSFVGSASLVSQLRFDNSSNLIYDDKENQAWYASPSSAGTFVGVGAQGTKEGGGAVFMYNASPEGIQCTDAGLSSDFPLKSSHATKKGTACFWFMYPVDGMKTTIWGKYSQGPLWFMLEDGPGYTANIAPWWRNADGSGGYSLGSISINIAQWYHFGIRFDWSTNKILNIRVFDSITEVVTDYNFSPSQAGYPGTGGFYVEGNNVPAFWDEHLVFNDVFLTDSDIDAIRKQIYSSTVTGDLAATLPALTGQFIGGLVNFGDLAVELPALEGAFEASRALEWGDLNATLPALTGEFEGFATPAGVLNVNLPALVGEFEGIAWPAGRIEGAVLPALTALFIGNVPARIGRLVIPERGPREVEAKAEEEIGTDNRTVTATSTGKGDRTVKARPKFGDH